MNILFYIEPWIERKNPEFRFWSFMHDLPINQFIEKKEKYNFKFVVGEAVNFYLKTQAKALYKKIKDDIIVVSENELRGFNDNYLSAQIDIFQDNLSEDQQKGYKAFYQGLLKDFVPDVIISWESPTIHFRHIFPEALILNQYHNSLFRFSHTKTADRYIFDPYTLKHSLILDAIDNISGADVRQEAIDSISDIRSRYYTCLLLDYEFIQIIDEYKRKYSKVMLLPFQGSHFNFEGNSFFNSQFDFLLYVLNNIDPSVAVIVTEHHLLYGNDLTEKNTKYLKSRFPNLIYSVDFRVPHISTQLLPLVDGVISVSSTLAWSARLLNKHVCIIGNSWYKKISTVQLEDIHTLKEEAANIDNVLAYLIYSFSVTFEDFKDADYITSYIEKLFECHKIQQAPISWFRPNKEISLIKEDIILSIQENILGTVTSKVNNAQIVSFDIFDTLLQSNVLIPTDIFRLMNREVDEIVGASTDFMDLRCLAEARAKKNAPETYEDITLDEIYIELEFYGIQKDHCEKIKALEIAWEKKLLVKRPSGKKLFDLALQLNKKIILVSDTHLSQEILKNILEKNGYTKYDHLYVSSETRTKKDSGTLYQQVINEQNCSPYDILHIGDDIYGDIIKSQEFGIKNFHLRAALDNFFASQPANALWKNHDELNKLSVYDRCALALIINRYFEDAWRTDYYSLFSNGYEQAGYFAFGPLIFDAVSWVYGACQNKNYDALLMMGKDSSLPNKVWNKIAEISPSEQKTKILNLYGAQSFYISWLLDENRTSLLKYNRATERVDIHHIVTQWLNIDTGKLSASKIQRLHLDHVIYSDEDFLINMKEIRDVLYDEIHQNAQNIEKYYHQIVGDNKKLALLDIGYCGRAYSILSAILNQKIDGYSFVPLAEDMQASEKISIKSYLTDSTDEEAIGRYHIGLKPILEMALSDLNLPFHHIIGKDGEVDFIYKNIQTDDNANEQMNIHKGILNFTDDFIATFGDETPYMQLSKEYTSKILQYLCYCEKDNHLWKRLHFSDNANLEGLRYDEYYRIHHLDPSLCLAYPKNKKVIPSQNGMDIFQSFPPRPDVRGIKKLVSKDYLRYKCSKILIKKYNNIKPIRPVENGIKKYISIRYYVYRMNKLIYRSLKEINRGLK